MYLGISSSLQHSSPEEWAAKHKALGLETVNFPVTCDDGEDVRVADRDRKYSKRMAARRCRNRERTATGDRECCRGAQGKYTWRVLPGRPAERRGV